MIHWLSKYMGWLRRKAIEFLVPLASYPELERLGTKYGGWIIPRHLLSATSICYCAGVGEDISFDQEVMRRYSCQVFAFDPTPRSKAYVESFQNTLPRYVFKNVGLWSSDSWLKFYAPQDPRNVSHSILNLQRTNEYFVAECKTLATLMKEFGHARIDLLKMDIEGAEHEIIRTIVDAGLNIKVLCVEFNQPMPLRTILSSIRKLREGGFLPIAREGWNYTFMKT